MMLNLEKISALGASHDLVEATPEGTIDLEQLHDAIQPRTQAFCFAWANSLTGVIQPVEEIVAVCQERGVKVIVDASALAGLYDTSLKGLDFLSYWGNPMGSISASALIWMKKGRKLPSLMPCGHDWMHSTATHPAALMALATAAKLTQKDRDRHLWHLMSLQEKFENTLKEKAGPLTILFENSQRLAHVSAVAFHGVHGELLAWHLNRTGIYATFGGGSRQQLHYLLKACHVPDRLQHMALSFAFSAQMTLEHVQEAACLIADNVHMIRKMHHF
jgi:cysteine desulfurase